MADQVPERSKDVPSTGDMGPRPICLIVVGREATAAELGYHRCVVEVEDDVEVEVVKDNVQPGVEVRFADE